MSNKTMPDPKLEKLNKLFSLIKEDTITPKEIEQFLVMVLDVIKKSKTDIEKISEDTIEKIEESIAYIESNYNLKSVEIDNKSAQLVKNIEKKFDDVNKIIAKLNLIKPIDGKDGKDGKDADEELVVEKVLNKIELPKEESAEDIVEKINSLPLDEEYKIDASHIKNLPVTKGVSGGVRALRNLNDVNIQDPTNSQVLSYNSTTGLWENTTVGSGNADHLLFRVKNTNGTTITKGTPVAYSGWNSGENAIEVILGDYTQNVSIGILKQDLATGEFGDMISIGFLEGMDTSSFAEGIILYVGEGELISTQPTTNAQAIAFVLRSHAINGAIQISAQAPLDLWNPTISYETHNINTNTDLSSITSGEHIYIIDCTLSDVQFILPAPTASTAKFTFKKIDTSLNKVVVNTTTEKIDYINEEAHIFFKYNAFTIISNGDSWIIISKT